MIGGSADLTGSNNTRPKGMKAIAATDYSGRFIHYGGTPYARLPRLLRPLRRHRRHQPLDPHRAPDTPSHARLPVDARTGRTLRGRPSFAAWLRRVFLPGGSALQPLAGAALSIGIALVIAGTILPAPTISTQENGAAAGAPQAFATAAPSDGQGLAADASESAAPLPAAALASGMSSRNATTVPYQNVDPTAAASAGPIASDNGGTESTFGTTGQAPSTAAPSAAATVAPVALPTAAVAPATQASGEVQPSMGITKSATPNPGASESTANFDQATPGQDTGAVAAATQPPATATPLTAPGCRAHRG